MRTPWLAAAVGLLALVVHARAKAGDFLFHDDYRYVVNNEAIEHVGDPRRFFTDLSTLSPHMPTKDIYRPVRTLSYAVITALFTKASAAPFHGAAILLHAGTSVLLLLLLLRAGLGRFAAATGALFFAFSPVTVEVTAWVCSLGDAWCGFFAAASVLAYAADRRILAVAALVLALFSKEHAVVVPGVWLLWDLCLRPERLRAGGGRLATGLTGAAGALAVTGFLLFRGHVAGAGMSQLPEPLGGSHWNAALTMTAGLGWYLATILLPYGPTFDAVVATRETPLDFGVLLGLLGIVALAFGLLRGPRRVRLGLAWFLVALVPVHNVFVPLKIPTADRFLYLPLMGLAFALGELAERARAVRWAVPALALLAVLAVVRIGDWKDSEALWTAGLRVEPKSRRLIWEEAAIGAERAVHASIRGDDATAERIGTQAAGVYQLFLKNSEPVEQTQVFVEFGDLLFQLGRGRARFAEMEQQREALGRAFLAYGAASSLQGKGIGRTTDEEIRHVAERIVQIAVDLLPGNENPGPIIEKGLLAAALLKERYGVDDTGAQIVFRLADGVRVREDHPKEARKQFDWVLGALDRVEQKGTRFPFIRAQAHYYRGVLKDEDFNRSDLEFAHDYYRLAEQDPAIRLRALTYRGRCLCTIGFLFRDPSKTAEGRQILQSVPAVAARERLRMDSYLKREVVSLEAGCGR